MVNKMQLLARSCITGAVSVTTVQRLWHLWIDTDVTTGLATLTVLSLLLAWFFIFKLWTLPIDSSGDFARDLEQQGHGDLARGFRANTRLHSTILFCAAIFSAVWLVSELIQLSTQ